MDKKEARVVDAINKTIQQFGKRKACELRDYVNSHLPREYKITNRQLGQKLRCYT